MAVDVYLVNPQLELIKSGFGIPDFPPGEEPQVLLWGDRVFQRVSDADGEKPGYPWQYKEVVSFVLTAWSNSY